MPTYTGTNGNDKIDQLWFGPLPIPGENYPNIFGLSGDDEIIVYRGRAIGGPGYDTLIASGDTSGISFEGSPGGVLIDIPKGYANDRRASR